MKIALCLEYPLAQHGGVEVLVSELVRGLGARHQILLVSPDDAASLAKSPAAPFVKEHISFSPVWNSISHARGLAEKIKLAKPDIVHFHFGGNYGWGSRAFWNCPVFYFPKSGVPVISTNHGAFSIFEGYCGEHRKFLKLALFLPAWLSKQIVLAHLRCEIAVSQNDFRNLRRWYPLVREKFRWIYHSRLHGTPPPENLDREKIILCAGTIGARKDQPLLAEAFARVAKKIPGWQLVFIGRGNDDDSLRQIHQIVAREKLEDHVRLLGARSDDELRDWLRQSAIFAMPSVYEGLGLALQEAQFYGCACVATRCGGPADLIEDGENGFLVPVGQPAPLADALEKLMGDEKLRERFGRRAAQSVLEKGMTTDKMVGQHEKLYAEILTR
ncbi:MAG TPA: glycosyltransferase family 4 protein [Dongiaceae bacterium]|jgi:glycosyltransferase involved in cell wall biosynthesis|nr:glycosyltransferase family 4 protein [Dongiaceae bacterium]